jgi:RimJ/RimL family protein N-acetyltransferase
MTILLRKASLDDAILLLDWRNDQDTRMASHNTDAVDMASHLSWLEKSLSNEKRAIFIAEISGQPVGSVRQDILDSGISEMSWTVAPSHRGRGVAKEMIKAACDIIHGELYAEIKIDNVSSVKAAESVGFIITNTSDGVHFLTRK